MSGGHDIEPGNTCNLHQATDLPNTDPLAATVPIPVGTTWVIGLRAGSPAIDSGDDANCLAVDQRGSPRPIDGDGSVHCDRGAVEHAVAADTDADGLADELDDCPLVAGPVQHDADRDGVGDVCDACNDLADDGYGNPASAACAHLERDCRDIDPDVNPSAIDDPYTSDDEDCNPATPPFPTTTMTATRIEAAIADRSTATTTSRA